MTELLGLIKNRRAIRKYKEEQITDDAASASIPVQVW